jgi:type VI secretion system protein ImpG
MDDELLSYYERELSFTRRMAAEFGQIHPKIASRLLLETEKCEDPHMERLVQSFAYECARLHQRIDDDFPEITNQLLEMVFPHFTRPIPSMSVVRFHPDMATVPASGYLLDRNTHLFSHPVDGIHCQFFTAYPVTLRPVEIVSAGIREADTPGKKAGQIIFIKLKCCNGLCLDQIQWESLRFHITGPSRHALHIHELILNHAAHVEYDAGNRHGKKVTVPLTPGAIRPVGFDSDQAILSAPGNEFHGFILLLEYFHFPEKFLFIDFTGLGRCNRKGMDTIELRIYLDRDAKPDLRIDKNTFALNCTPVINLFSHTCSPVRVERHKSGYRIIPDDNPDAAEIYRIDRVDGSIAGRPDFELPPLYSTRNHTLEEERGTLWRMERKSSGRKGDHGSDVALHFSDPGMKPVPPAAEQIIIHAACTNRDLASRLSIGEPAGDLELESPAPVLHTNFIMKPLPAVRPFSAATPEWEALSTLDPAILPTGQGQTDAFKTILRLYDCSDTPVTRRMIDGISSIRTRFITRRMERSFQRGLEITVEFDKDAYEESGLYLFASVLELFFSRYVSSNSFIQMIAKNLPDGEVFKVWPPRRGARELL